ncbi:MAG: acyl-ACP--UDP-N-acetylglucosamine O-acyltransferase [Phycisphaeraceae bacterium]|nr:acyl-ACP--UDP-N-acetylglucosamine O-acyltransferase [Phycisphaeraceae bacterium]
MANIHPTATVDPKAQLADDVDVGPGCAIVGRVTLGAGCRLVANAIIRGPATFGRNNLIYPFTCLGYAPQDRKFDVGSDGAGLLVGDDNIFRESVTIHRATGDRPTTVGNRNYWMVNSHAGHDCVIGDDCTFANNILLGGHVHLANHVILGGNAGVHQFCRIGRLCMISGLAGITQDVPPFCVVYETRYVGSLNIVGLRRAGYRDHIPALKKAFDIIWEQGHRNSTAVELIETQLGDDPLCMEMAQFIRASKRGICRYRQADEE